MRLPKLPGLRLSLAGALLLALVIAVDVGRAARRRASSSPPPPPSSSGIWISPAEIRALPRSGPAWEAVYAAGQPALLAPVLSNEREDADVRLLAKAYVYCRTLNPAYRDQAIQAIRATMETENGGRTLALGRNLLPVVIAAELVQLGFSDRIAFSIWLGGVRHELLGGRTLISTHEDRPNNWGTNAGASRMAADLYLGDFEDLERAIAVFRGYLGDASAWSGFHYGDDLSWHADELNPLATNPLGASKLGFSIDGVLPDDQRRGGPFQWPPPVSNYPYGALQGAIAQALILHRLGHDVWSWQDQALLRAFRWLDEEAVNPIEGDDEWMGHLVNRYYGTAFPAPVPASPGKNMGFTDWTHPSP
jgi:hypothetical protein